MFKNNAAKNAGYILHIGAIVGLLYLKNKRKD